MRQEGRERNPRTLGWWAAASDRRLDAMNETIEFRGVQITIRTATPRLTLTDHTIPAGFAGPPLHVHPGFDEVFLVADGTLTLRIEDQVQEVGAGETAYVAGAVPHTFANTSGAPVRFMVAIAPGGFEEYFRRMAAGDEEGAMRAAEQFGYAPWPG